MTEILLKKIEKVDKALIDEIKNRIVKAVDPCPPGLCDYCYK